MLRKYTRNMGFLLLLLLLPGCATDMLQVPVNPDAIPNLQQAYALEGTQLYEGLSIDPNQIVTILDISGEIMLVAVENQITPDSAGFREVGLNSVTSRLAAISLRTGEIQYEMNLEDSYCTGGVLLSNQKTLFSVLELNTTEDYQTSYQLFMRHGTGDIERLLLSGMCELSDMTMPRLLRLDEESAAYSYWDIKAQKYGISQIDSNGIVTEHLAFDITSESSPISTSLSGCNGQYLYFAEKDSQGVFYVGGAHGLKSQFSLPQNEKIYSYCLGADGVLFSSSLIDEAGVKANYLIWKSLDGTVKLQRQNQPIYRLVANGKSLAFGINREYQIYKIETLATQLDIQPLDTATYAESGSPVLFYPYGGGNMLLHFYSEDQRKILLYEGKGPVPPS